MKTLVVLLGFALFLLLQTSVSAAECQFVLGFKTIRDLIGHSIVGECLENQRYNAIGNSEQHTTGGLLVWRKADNWTAFTDGYRSWVSGPNGLQQRLNTERFEWEADYTAITGQAAASALTRDALRSAEYAAGLPTYGRIAVQPFLDFGDLNGDGIDDAAVVLSLVDGNAAHRYLAAVLNENGEPVHVDSAYLGLNIGLRSVTIQDGIITVKMAQLAPGDPTCCPTQETIATLRLNGNALELLSEVPPGQLTATAQRQARPTVDPARIDPGLAAAFQRMRNAPFDEIDELYDWFAAAVVRAQFGPLEESISHFNPSTNLITINEEYRDESLEALVHALIWPLAFLHAIDERGGSPQSYDECIADFIAAHSARALWWLGIYAAGGKQNPTRLEQGANYNLARYLDKSLGSWVRSSDHYRQYCAQFGEPPPVPTSTPSPALTLPWDSATPKEELHDLVVRSGHNPGTLEYVIYNTIYDSGRAHAPIFLFLPWLDATGRGIEDSTPDLWQQFFGAMLTNADFRSGAAKAIRDYWESNTHLGPVLTAFLKAEYISSLDERIEFMARVEDAIQVSQGPDWLAEQIGATEQVLGTRDCYRSSRCSAARSKLRDSLIGKDLATITVIPSPWKK